MARLSVTHRTHETYKEYLQGVGSTPRQKKDWRDKIKDVGGFVGGMLSGPRRLAGNVVHRQVVTLDCDKADADLWTLFTLLYGCAACLYSTHSHSPEAPKYRLVVPLDRPCDPAEYEAVARKLAEHIGINQVDHTCFYPHQLMYWPSTAKDGVFVFEQQQGDWLSVDAMLAMYTNWRDTDEWPLTDAEQQVVQRGITKQVDPLEKPGIVGAFCRTYSITEVLSVFLADVYEPCDVEDRYTYKAGTTSAGLVIYEDKFAYSHHGTDPTCGKLCNAFDLVRLHLYGLKDEDARDGTPPQKLPSFIAMADLARQNERVCTLLTREQLEQAQEDFSEVRVTGTGELVGGENGSGDSEPGSPEPESNAVEENIGWMAKLDRERNGKLLATIDNLVRIIENDKGLKGAIAFDVFAQCPHFTRDVPWRKVTKATSRLTDMDDANMEHYLEKLYDISTSRLQKAMSVVLTRHSYHPVRDYLNGLRWDGKYRVESVLIDYLGAEDSEYTRAVTRKWLIAGVARIFKPGIKFDNVLTLVGEEGRGKSTIFAKLGGPWFSDTFNFHMLQSKEGYEQLVGKWIIEIAELSGMKKTDDERIKGFLSGQTDHFRVAYGRRPETFYRQNLFGAGTNKRDFLRSVYGNRRFWPVEIEVNTPAYSVFDMDAGTVGQIWAEALYYYQQGESLVLSKELIEDARIVQQQHMQVSSLAGVIEKYLETPIPITWGNMDKYERIAYLENPRTEEETDTRSKVCVIEIWEECLKRREVIDSRSDREIRDIMAQMEGWKPVPDRLRYGSYGRQRHGWMKEGKTVSEEG